jgi:hypothetical protein
MSAATLTGCKASSFEYDISSAAAGSCSGSAVVDTCDRTIEDYTIPMDGVDYWALEIDFVVGGVSNQDNPQNSDSGCMTGDSYVGVCDETTTGYKIGLDGIGYWILESDFEVQ